MPKHKKKSPHWEKRLNNTMLALSLFTLVMLIIFGVKVFFFDGILARDRAVSDYAKKAGNEDVKCVYSITAGKALAIINYDCVPKNETQRALKECSGTYLVVVEKVNGEWLVNESSRQVLS